MTCRLHGGGCRIPAGWDGGHTDSARPYTAAELAVRQQPPHYYAYPDRRAYLEGWALWRAYRREARLSAAEADAKFNVLVEAMQERSGLDLREFLQGE